MTTASRSSKIIDVWNIDTFDDALRGDLDAHAELIRDYYLTSKRLWLERCPNAAPELREALETSGGTKLIADWLSHAAASLPVWGAVGLILVAAMAVTPFLNNAATVLVMAPIAAVFAHDLGYRPEAFLIATAMGAGCDFLTPIGHQCNTLVMGPGGYRFGDYWRLGLPLSLIVVGFGVPLIALVWPLS